LSPAIPEVEGVEHRWVAAGDVSLHVAEAGAGPPVVLLHGWPQHWWIWRKVVPLLAPHARLIMPDLRGFGWSEAPASGYEKQQLAGDVLALLDALGLDRVGLVGHDWGGWAGWLLCARAPERIERFVALDIPPPFGATSLTPARLARLAYQPVLAAPLLGEAIVRRPGVIGRVIRAGARRRDAWSAEDLQIFEAPLREPARARASSLLYRTFLTRELGPIARGHLRGTRVDVPVRALFGAQSPIRAPDPLAGLNAADVEGEVVEDCGHFVAEEHPELVVARIRAFLGLSSAAT
jgi:pimeloyl-ACP methyl ester carboxylesterase